jgi:hypothetical protein
MNFYGGWMAQYKTLPDKLALLIPVISACQLLGLIAHDNALIERYFFKAIFITIIIGLIFLVGKDAGKVIETVSFFGQLCFGAGRGFFHACHCFLQYTPVSAKDIVYVAYIVATVAVELVVVVITTVIVTKLLIGPAFHGFTAGWAVSGFLVHCQ